MYQIVPFSIFRTMVADAARVGMKIPYINILSEVDITGIRSKLKEFSDKSHVHIGLHDYLLACYVMTINEKKELQGYKDWRRRMFIFDEIDVFCPIELKIAHDPVLYFKIIRAANRKRISAIAAEIQEAVQQKQIPILPAQKVFLHLPEFVRNLFYYVWVKSPKTRKELFGTAYFSCVWSISNDSFWGIPIPPSQSLGMIVTQIKKTETIENGIANSKEVICFTVSADHGIVDGAELCRFVNRFKKHVHTNLDSLEKLD